MTWFVLAPGPSMSQSVADSLKGKKVCAVSNVFQLAPWADLLVANDRKWWSAYPDAHKVESRKFSANRIEGVELVNPHTFGTSSNSGVLALDVVRNLGAEKVVMLGFDSQGTHFFGPYTNGCRNTPERRRHEHRLQFVSWAHANKKVQVVNCTPGSLIDAFPRGELKDHLNG